MKTTEGVSLIIAYIRGMPTAYFFKYDGSSWLSHDVELTQDESKQVQDWLTKTRALFAPTRSMKKSILSEVLWGGAVADAIGNPLEFKATVTDQDFHSSVNQKKLMISDDTQMSLFAYEALHLTGNTNSAYSRWYVTQLQSTPRLVGAEGLLSFKSLYHREAPGTTCMRSCDALAKGKPVQNNSKGNGTVMRVAPIAVVAYLENWTDEAAYLMAKEDALLTHKHPFAWQSSVLLTSIYLSLFRGNPLPVAILTAVSKLPSCAEVGKLVTSIMNVGNYNLMRSRRCGWIAEEALALAVGANLHCHGYLNVVREACQGSSSDSDTVAGIAGSLSAAMGGPAPDILQHKVASSDAIEYIIDLYQDN